jgi:hypothetical protein
MFTTAVLSMAMPATALGHTLTDRYQAPLPLVAYVAGAALAVAMSFAFVMLRNAPPPTGLAEPRPARVVPLWLRLALNALGLLGLGWIALQTLVGGSGDGDVASLFLWTYGWVGIALVSAFIGPAWEWIDPFATLHRILGALGARAGISAGEPARYPERLGKWPAVLGMIAVIWLELVARIEGGRSLGLLLLGYTALNLGAMSYFGRETWRSNGEVFTVWFRLLGRLAPIGLVGSPDDGQVRRRPFGHGLLSEPWTASLVTLVLLGTGSIIYDGLSQTQLYFDTIVLSGVLGTGLVRDTISLVVFLGVLAAVVYFVARRVGFAAIGAGLLPVAVGYLIAHYLAFLLVDGQRIILAINDPLLRGDNLLPLDLGFWEPSLFLPTAVLWSIQLGAVVGGHILGAWAGHAVLEEGPNRRSARLQMPLAALMIVLTSVTLWSLGQAVLIEEPAEVSARITQLASR